MGQTSLRGIATRQARRVVEARRRDLEHVGVVDGLDRVHLAGGAAPLVAREDLLAAEIVGAEPVVGKQSPAQYEARLVCARDATATACCRSAGGQQPSQDRCRASAG